jgi:hypothetical protein
MRSATIRGLPAALAVSKLADVLLCGAPPEGLVGVLVQRGLALLAGLQVASETPAELSAAIAIAQEASAPSSNRRATLDLDLGVATTTASNCPITSAFHDAPPRQVRASRTNPT